MYDICVIFNKTDVEALTPDIYDYVNLDGSSKDLQDAQLALELAGEKDRELSVTRYILEGEDVQWDGDPLDFIQHHAYLSDAEEGPQLTPTDIQRLKTGGVWNDVYAYLIHEDYFYKTSFHRRGINASPEQHFVEYVLEMWPWWAMSDLDKYNHIDIHDEHIPEQLINDLMTHHSHRVVFLSNSIYVIS